jgi:hypothetical protein
MQRITSALLWRLWLCLMGLLCLTEPTVMAATPMRAVILFDNSGSMRQNDPLRLSRVAAQLFVALAQSQDQIGLIGFSNAGNLLFPLTHMATPVAKQSIVTRLHTLHFDGHITDLGAALQAGLASFPPQKTGNSRDVVLLLTDGKLDLGAQRRSAESGVLEYLHKVQLPQYVQRGIAIYTIAFTAAADQSLLQDMAQRTGGEFRFAPSAPLLHKAFSDMFVVAKDAESLPIRNGAVVMDNHIEQAALILAKPNAQEPMGLVTPQQQRLDARTTHPGVRWQVTPSYDMIQLTNPAPGTWRIERTSANTDDVAIIGASTLSLHVSLGPEFLEANEPLSIRARLLQNDQLLSDPRQLQTFTVQAELTSPAGDRQAITLLPVSEAGEFAATITTPAEPGQYRIVVLAKSDTVERQRTVSFVPQPRCFLPSTAKASEVTVQVTLSDACPVFDRLALEAGYVTWQDQPPEHWFSLQESLPRHFQTVLPPPETASPARILLRFHGRREQQDFVLLKGPLSVPDLSKLPILSLAPPTLDWSALARTVGWQLLVINTILGGGGAGGYYLYRSRIHHRRIFHE